MQYIGVQLALDSWVSERDCVQDNYCLVKK